MSAVVPLLRHDRNQRFVSCLFSDWFRGSTSLSLWLRQTLPHCEPKVTDFDGGHSARNICLAYARSTPMPAQAGWLPELARLLQQLPRRPDVEHLRIGCQRQVAVILSPMKHFEAGQRSSRNLAPQRAFLHFAPLQGNSRPRRFAERHRYRRVGLTVSSVTLAPPSWKKRTQSMMRTSP